MEDLKIRAKCKYRDRVNSDLIHPGIIIGESAHTYVVVLPKGDPYHFDGTAWEIPKNEVEVVDYSEKEILNLSRAHLTNVVTNDILKTAIEGTPGVIEFRVIVGDEFLCIVGFIIHKDDNGRLIISNGKIKS